MLPRIGNTKDLEHERWSEVTADSYDHAREASGTHAMLQVFMEYLNKQLGNARPRSDQDVVDTFGLHRLEKFVGSARTARCLANTMRVLSSAGALRHTAKQCLIIETFTLDGNSTMSAFFVVWGFMSSKYCCRAEVLSHGADRLLVQAFIITHLISLTSS